MKLVQAVCMMFSLCAFATPALAECPYEFGSETLEIYQGVWYPNSPSTTVPSWWVTDYCAVDGGRLAVRTDYPLWVSGKWKTLNSIDDIVVDAGWSHRILRSGGYDADVEVEFTNGVLRNTIRVSVKGGKTKIETRVY